MQKKTDPRTLTHGVKGIMVSSEVSIPGKCVTECYSLFNQACLVQSSCQGSLSAQYAERLGLKPDESAKEESTSLSVYTTLAKSTLTPPGIAQQLEQVLSHRAVRLI